MGAEGEEREERAVSGTCLTVGVTLLLLVFAFELPNKSDTYLCLLLIYDFIGAAVPGPGGRAARPQRCAHTRAWLCIAGKIARAVNDNRKALLETCGLRQQMLLSHLFKPAELLSFRAFRADFTPSQQSVLEAPALRGGDGARSQGHLVLCAPRSPIHPRRGWAGSAAPGAASRGVSGEG